MKKKENEGRKRVVTKWRHGKQKKKKRRKKNEGRMENQKEKEGRKKRKEGKINQKKKKKMIREEQAGQWSGGVGGGGWWVGLPFPSCNPTPATHAPVPSPHTHFAQALLPACSMSVLGSNMPLCNICLFSSSYSLHICILHTLPLPFPIPSLPRALRLLHFFLFAFLILLALSSLLLGF